MTNPIALMLAAMVAYSIPILAGVLLWRVETPVQRIRTSMLTLSYQGLCLFFWSFVMVKPDTFNAEVIGQGTLLPTLALCGFGWSKLTNMAAIVGEPTAVEYNRMQTAWVHTVIVWAMMLVLIAHSFFH